MGTHYVNVGTFQLMNCAETPYRVHWTPAGSSNCDHLLCDNVYTCRQKKCLGGNEGFTFRVVLKPRKQFEHAITKTFYRVFVPSLFTCTEREIPY
jgi:hypothetical protein